MKRLSIIIEIMFTILFFASCSSNTPTKVAEQSMKCLMDKDYKGYVDLIYFSEKEKKNPEEYEQGKQQLAALLKDKAEKEYKRKGDISSYETITEETSNDGKTANVKMKINYGNGTNEDTDIKLRKDKDGNWKIDMGK